MHVTEKHTTHTKRTTDPMNIFGCGWKYLTRTLTCREIVAMWLSCVTCLPDLMRAGVCKRCSLKDCKLQVIADVLQILQHPLVDTQAIGPQSEFGIAVFSDSP